MMSENQSQPTFDTASTLRDRIAAVITQVAQGRALDQLTTTDASVIADAIIAALKRTHDLP